MHHVCIQCSRKPVDGVISPETALRVILNCRGSWELHLGPMKEQEVIFTSEPSPLPETLSLTIPKSTIMYHEIFKRFLMLKIKKQKNLNVQ